MRPAGNTNGAKGATDGRTIPGPRPLTTPAAPTAPSERLMTADEVADLLRVPRSTVYELARTRRIPYLKIGRRTLFEPRSITDWIAARTMPPLR